MNWGKSIVLTFILFASFIISMVVMMSRKQVDLVRDDYYQDELEYQQHIDRLAHTDRLKTPINMIYEPTQQQVAFVLQNSVQKGDITFYRPSDRKQDVHVPIYTEQLPRQVISTGKLAKGYWRVQLAWSDGRQEYYTEQELFIE